MTKTETKFNKELLGEQNMKEVLFRGKRKDNGEWIYGWYAPLVCNDKTIIPCIRNKNGTDKEVIPETVE